MLCCLGEAVGVICSCCLNFNACISFFYYTIVLEWNIPETFELENWIGVNWNVFDKKIFLAWFLNEQACSEKQKCQISAKNISKIGTHKNIYRPKKRQVKMCFYSFSVSVLKWFNHLTKAWLPGLTDVIIFFNSLYCYFYQGSHVTLKSAWKFGKR